MSLAELFADLLEFVGAVIGVAQADVYVLPVEKGGTNWGQVTIAALVAFVVGVGTILNGARSVRNQKLALVHDREMRVRDDVRDVLAKTLEDVEQALSTLEDVRVMWRARRQQEKDEYLEDDVVDGERRGLPEDHEERRSKVDAIDDNHAASMRRLAQQRVQLRLFFDDDDEPLRTFLVLLERMDVARVAWHDTFLDPHTGAYVLGEPYRAHLQMQKKAHQDAEVAAQQLGSRAARYVRGEPPATTSRPSRIRSAARRLGRSRAG